MHQPVYKYACINMHTFRISPKHPTKFIIIWSYGGKLDIWWTDRLLVLWKHMLSQNPLLILNSIREKDFFLLMLIKIYIFGPKMLMFKILFSNCCIKFKIVQKNYCGHAWLLRICCDVTSYVSGFLNRLSCIYHHDGIELSWDDMMPLLSKTFWQVSSINLLDNNDNFQWCTVHLTTTTNEWACHPLYT